MTGRRRQIPERLVKAIKAVVTVAMAAACAGLWVHVAQGLIAENAARLGSLYGALALTVILGVLLVRLGLTILHRYLLDEMTKTFVVALVAITAVVSLALVLMKLQQYGLSPLSAIKLMGLAVPFAVYLALPLAAVLAATLVYGRLTAENEVLACRASGIPLSSLLWPGVLLALVTSGASLALAVWPLGESKHAMEQLALEDIERLFYTQLASAGEVRDKTKTYQLTVDRVMGDLLSGPTVKYRKEGRQTYCYAPLAKVEFDRQANRVNIMLWEALGQDEPGETWISGTHPVSLELPTTVPRKIDERPIWELMAAQHYPERFSPTLEEMQADKADAAAIEREKAKVRARAMAEMHSRLAGVAGCLGLVILGVGLGVLFHSGHLLMAFGVALLPWLPSVFLTRTGKDFVAGRMSEPQDALYLVWLPNVAMLALAALVLVHLVWFWSRPRRRPARRARRS